MDPWTEQEFIFLFVKYIWRSRLSLDSVAICRNLILIKYKSLAIILFAQWLEPFDNHLILLISDSLEW